MQFRLFPLSLGCGLALTFVTPVLSQIMPNGVGTLVDSQGNQINITGGTQAGANLFHSFQNFNLTSSQIANFLSNPQTRNILARINGGNPSAIDGLLQVSGGNSNLFLMNPSGIIFGANARLNVPASFTATTANSIGFGNNNLFNALGNNNYAALTGNPDSFLFTTTQAGSIVNAGNLTVGNNQNISLIAGNTVNTGRLTAPGGEIQILAVPGTDRVRLSQPGQVLSLEFVPPVSNELRAVDLPTLLTGSNVPGIQLDRAGQVQINGTSLPTQQGIAVASGSINVSSATGIGGVVQVLGDRVAVLNSRINANGATGGGRVRLGGEYRGGINTAIVPSLRFNAQGTLVDADSLIRANAATTGDGGRVIVWADDTTRFYGNISARGGAGGGNGGFAEVSGAQNLTFAGNADLSAPQGSFGTLLLDPVNIFINNVGPNSLGTCTLPNVPAACGPGDVTITQATLQALPAAANVVLEATNNITIATLAGALGFNNGPGGSITFHADRDGDGVGDFSMNPGNGIFAAARDITIRGANITTGTVDVSSNAANGGNLSLIATNTINAGNLLSTSTPGNGGQISITAGGNITTGFVQSASNGANGVTNGSITINSTNGSITTGYISTTTSVGIGGRAGDITLNAAGNIQTSSNIHSSSNVGNGGNINLNAGGNIQIGNEVITWTFNGLGSNGNIGINAGGNIQVGNIISATLNSTTNGGNISLNAGNDIQTREIRSYAGTGNGGFVSLLADRNITIESINAQNRIGTTGFGGNVTINAGQFFRATDGILTGNDRYGTLSSITASGGAGGGLITITHGGSTSVPFIVGNPTTNGTLFAITSGPGANIVSNITVPVPPEINNYGTNISIRTSTAPPTIPLPNPPTPVSPATPVSSTIPIAVLTLLQNPSPPPTPAPVIVGTLTEAEPTPVITAPPAPLVVPSPEVIPSPVVILPPIPSPAVTPPPAPILSPSPDPAPDTALDLPIAVGRFYPQNSPTPEPPLGTLVFVTYPPREEIASRLRNLGNSQYNLPEIQNNLNQTTETKTAQIYVFFTPENLASRESDTLEILLITGRGEPMRVQLSGITRSQVLGTLDNLQNEFSNAPESQGYLRAGQQIYRWLLAPLESELQQQGINNLVFIMDEALRSLPIEAIYDGQGLITERYTISKPE
jgi:filamentous hemagglutinin family protein